MYCQVRPIYWVLWVLMLSACGTEDRKDPPPEFGEATVTFNWFEYRGEDPVFERALKPDHYRNPILAGFYPDPSITRGKDAWYMVHSSFAWFPGVPVFRSTDLVNWQPLGHVLTRASQLSLKNAGVSRGIYAPTIRYHQGHYYVITTQVDRADGNFIVSAEDPAGEWSEPVYLPEIQGIDPSLFFDDNGKVYITHNGAAPGTPLYEGHRAIWLWEFDLGQRKVLANSGRIIVNGGSDLSKEPIWIEGPHIYKINGWYYLICAEGGTAENHSEVVFRTRSLELPFVAYEGNPILTQRDLDSARPNPIATAGHADMVQTPDGNWWAVFLATRNYRQNFFNTGRETFLLPVRWRNGWPVILPPGEAIPHQAVKPAGLPETPHAVAMTGNIHWREDFKTAQLGPEWSSLRASARPWSKLLPKGGLLMQAMDISLDSARQPAFIARRQQNIQFQSQLSLDLPQEEGVLGGLAVFQSEQAHFFIGVKKSGSHYRVLLERAAQAAPEVIASKVFPRPENQQRLVLGVQVREHMLEFYFQHESGEKTRLGPAQDARVLSTQWAGGFVGTHIGLHARTTTSIQARAM